MRDFRPLAPMRFCGKRTSKQNVFIRADTATGQRGVRELTGCTDPAEIQKIIARRDESRPHLLRHYTGKKWGDSRNL